MIKRCFFYASLTVVIAFLSSGFKPFELGENDWFLVDKNKVSYYLFPSQKQTSYRELNVPYTGKFFVGYKEAIAFRESRGKYEKINTLGYMGKYQFGIETLKTVGIHDSSLFLKSPRMQEKAFITLLAQNKSLLKDEIEKYEGKVVSGILVTESGILAAAHLGGVGTVKKYFKNNGRRYFKDAYGTSIRAYMKEFGGYETTGIMANAKAKVRL